MRQSQITFWCHEIIRCQAMEGGFYIDATMGNGNENMDRYVQRETVDVICFNFGYLPGGCHEVATAADTSVEAIGKGLGLLKHGGMMSLCIYSGGDTGFEEKEEILGYSQIER